MPAGAFTLTTLRMQFLIWLSNKRQHSQFIKLKSNLYKGLSATSTNIKLCIYTMKKCSESKFTVNTCENIIPIKLTLARSLKFNTTCWGLLTDYYLESVKINAYESGIITSTAILEIGDRSGQISCVVKGPSIGLLFGLSVDEWAEVERSSTRTGQLFYRNFRNGCNSEFSIEQKLFYYFCCTNQKKDVLLAVFQRVVNRRKSNKNNALLYIKELQQCRDNLLESYRLHLTKDE